MALMSDISIPSLVHVFSLVPQVKIVSFFPWTSQGFVKKMRVGIVSISMVMAICLRYSLPSTWSISLVNTSIRKHVLGFSPGGMKSADNYGPSFIGEVLYRQLQPK